VIPGTNVEELISEVQAVVNDARVKITSAMGKGMPGGESTYRSMMNTAMKMKPSPTDSELFRALVSESNRVFPGVPVTTYLFQAGTDAGAWRSRGIPVYGIYPYPISPDELTRMHGNDERVSIKSLQQGTDLIYKTLLKVAAK
jgi:acetylornithine deacetylase/succinyl-diaminopimelate desuccinylase-like protein